ncbi:MAG TPA: hypothetical protein DDY77_04790 [Clostridiales bacterium]|nr:hypothetical protein [Clostridiales bacterium]
MHRQATADKAKNFNSFFFCKAVRFFYFYRVFAERDFCRVAVACCIDDSIACKVVFRKRFGFYGIDSGQSYKVADKSRYRRNKAENGNN